LEGPLVHHLCGEFCVCLHLECFGPGPEYTLPDPCPRIPMDPCGDGQYSYRINIPAGTIDPKVCGNVCCLAVTLTSFDPCGNPGHIAAYCRDLCVMFYAAT